MNWIATKTRSFLGLTLVSGLFLAVSLNAAPAFAQAATQPQQKATAKVNTKASAAAKKASAASRKKGSAKKQAAKASPGGASGQTFLIGTFGDWKALTTGADKQKVCYALSQPNQRLPAKLKRDPGYLFISNRIADGAKNEIAFKLGFAAKAGQEDQLAIGSSNFVLIGNGESAFLKNPAQEAQVIELMKRASVITIKITSARGNETSDRYSMNGISKALEAVAKECP